MFEQWFTWNVELMVEDDPMATGNRTTIIFLDYFIQRDIQRWFLCERMKILF